MELDTNEAVDELLKISRTATKRDDRHLQNADYIVPVVNRASAGSEGVSRAPARLNTVLTTADLASLNEQVDSWRRLPEDVARTYPESKKLLRT